MIKTLRRIKFLYEIHNIFNYKRLKCQISLYKKYGIRKSFFRTISSKDFPDNTAELPWLDRTHSSDSLPKHAAFEKLNNETKSALLNWSSTGYAILKNFYSEEQVDSVDQLLAELMKEKPMTIKDKRKIMHAVRHSQEIKSIVNNKSLIEIVELLLDRPVELFQSINFLQGSEDPAHSDFIHMSTYPYGYLIAVWVALEDIDTTNGPIFYYPGSHKLPYIMTKDLYPGGNRWLLGKDIKTHYTKAIEEVINNNKLEKRIFTASKGDVIIWHANLLHGGEKVLDPSRTRKSMVMHYFGTDVIQYHEITQRPSLKP